MLLIIFLVLLLLIVLTMIPGQLLTKQVGPAAQMGGRDDLPEPTIELARSRRALNNFQETMPVFLSFAILSIVLGEQGALSLAGGWLYLAGRIAHPVFYMRAMAPWRSIAYLVAMVGMLLMVIPLVPHLWN